MAPVQNTFSIIPNAPSALNGHLDTSDSRPSRPPMTTKQAKKAYSKANKGPKLSKAEQRRQDLFEQDRIRREFEKEKNQARAKASRDKKKEKEEKEKADRRRKGLPLIDVRPSQDTIARFVRTGIKKPAEHADTPPPREQPTLPLPLPLPLPLSRPLPIPSQHNDEDNDFDNDHNDDNHTSPGETGFEPPPPPKRPRIQPSTPKNENAPKQDTVQQLLAGEADEVSVPMDHVHSPRQLVQQPTEAKDKPVEEEEQDSSSIDMDVLLINELVNERMDDKSLEAESTPITKINRVEQENTMPSSGQRCKMPSPRPKSSGRPKSRGKENIPPPGYVEEPLKPVTNRGIHRGPLKTISSTPTAAPRTPSNFGVTRRSAEKQDMTSSYNSGSSSGSRTKRINRTSNNFNNFNTTNSPSVNTFRELKISATSSRPSHHVQSPMGPPPLPPKFKSPGHGHMGQSRPPTPKFLSKPSPAQASRKHDPSHLMIEAPDDVLPTSTQLFMANHLDDFFPSPSQEIREIFQEPTVATPMSVDTSRVRLGNSRLSATRPKTIHRDAPGPKPIALTKIVNISQPKSIESRGSANPKSISTISAPRTANVQTPEDPTLDMPFPFFSTQDLFLSSQDLKDIEEDISSPQVSQLQPTRRPDSQVATRRGRSQSRPTLLGDDDTSDMQGHQATALNACVSRSSGKSVIDDNQERQGSYLSSRFSSTNASSFGDAPIDHSVVVAEQVKDPVQTCTEGKSQCNRSATEGIGMSKDVANNEIKSEGTQALPEPKKPPKPSPKPFLASSGREMRYKYAIERSKTTAWEDVAARRKAQQQIEDLQRMEEERLRELLVEDVEREDVAEDSGVTHKSPPSMVQAEESSIGSRTRTYSHDQQKQKSSPTDDISGPRSTSRCTTTTTTTMTTTIQRNTSPAETQPPQYRHPSNRRPPLRSSYEEMLAFCEKASKEAEEQQQQQQQTQLEKAEDQQRRQDQIAIAASQETDYGGDDLLDLVDDELCRLL
ncbi:hypothetical protein F4778DRAFT_484219 [Xylariomycetidae sp. FL2044]|nr:hypothetical protein F4778DRAFT_484219 [Xylariomycetidae sp. FL2044]